MELTGLRVKLGGIDLATNCFTTIVQERGFNDVVFSMTSSSKSRIGHRCCCFSVFPSASRCGLQCRLSFPSFVSLSRLPESTGWSASVNAGLE